MNDTAVHSNPVLRDRANFIVLARIPGPVTTRKWEQLWARQLAPDEFELCCIPFFVRDLDLVDHVRTSRVGEKDHVIVAVIRKSGHCTFRVWLGETLAEVRDTLVAQLQGHGCSLEWYSETLLALDASTEVLAQEVGAFLKAGQDRGFFKFETGRTR